MRLSVLLLSISFYSIAAPNIENLAEYSEIRRSLQGGRDEEESDARRSLQGGCGEEESDARRSLQGGCGEEKPDEFNESNLEDIEWDEAASLIESEEEEEGEDSESRALGSRFASKEVIAVVEPSKHKKHFGHNNKDKKYPKGAHWGHIKPEYHKKEPEFVPEPEKKY